MKVSTSILSTIESVENCMRKLNETTSDYLHLDVMDGKFVTNNTVEMMEKAVTYNKLPLDIHLMVEDVDFFIIKYQALKPEYITFHIEVGKEIQTLIDKIKSFGIKAGLAINPNTDIHLLEPYLEFLDLVLVMSVTPGKGGQTFQKEVLNHITYLLKERQRNSYQFQIEVDGGINESTVVLVKNVDIIVSGSYIINGNYDEKINKLKEKCK